MAIKKIAASLKSKSAKQTPAAKPPVKPSVDDDELLDLDIDFLKPLKPGRKPGTENPGPMFRSELDIFQILSTENPGPMRTPVKRVRTRKTDNPGPMLRSDDDDFGIE